jgi:hypothetical protein
VLVSTQIYRKFTKDPFTAIIRKESQSYQAQEPSCSEEQVLCHAAILHCLSLLETSAAGVNKSTERPESGGPKPQRWGGGVAAGTTGSSLGPALGPLHHRT